MDERKRREREKKTNGDETHRGRWAARSGSGGCSEVELGTGDCDVMLLDSTGHENDAYLREEVGEQ